MALIFKKYTAIYINDLKDHDVPVFIFHEDIEQFEYYTDKGVRLFYSADIILKDKDWLLFETRMEGSVIFSKESFRNKFYIEDKY